MLCRQCCLGQNRAEFYVLTAGGRGSRKSFGQGKMCEAFIIAKQPAEEVIVLKGHGFSRAKNRIEWERGFSR